MNAYRIRYNLPDSSGHNKIILAESEETALLNLEKKDTDFKNIGGYFKVHSVKEVTFDEVKLSDLSVAEFLLLSNLNNTVR